MLRTPACGSRCWLRPALQDWDAAEQMAAISKGGPKRPTTQQRYGEDGSRTPSRASTRSGLCEWRSQARLARPADAPSSLAACGPAAYSCSQLHCMLPFPALLQPAPPCTHACTYARILTTHTRCPPLLSPSTANTFPPHTTTTIT